MAKAKGLYAKIPHEPIFHKTSIGRNPSLQKWTNINVGNLRNIVAKAVRGWQTSQDILYRIYDSSIEEVGKK